MNTAKVKTSELEGAQLDWAAKSQVKFSRTMAAIERIHCQSTPDGSGCRIWNGKKNQHGYGKCKVGGKEVRVHRALYFILNPTADQSKVVMHSCDNPACVNPCHLSLGSVKENMLDMHAKGRFRGGAKPGNKNSVGNKGWLKGGIVKSMGRIPAGKLGDEVEVPV